MKTTGALWKSYFASWPEGQWYDDCDQHVGADALEDPAYAKDDDVVEFSCGVIYEKDNDRIGSSMMRHFSAWRKSLHTEQFVCDVPKERVAEFLALITELGVKVKVG